MSEDHKRKIAEANRGSYRSEETKKKQSEIRKTGLANGHIKIWNKGKKGMYSEKSLERLRKSHLGYKMPEEQKKKIGEANKGKKRPPLTKEHLEKLSKFWFKKGMVSYNKGKHPEYLQKEKHPNWKGGKPKCIDCGEIHPYGKSKRCLQCNKKWQRGENAPVWNGGSSFEPYPMDWTQTFRRSIRERDKYTCRICGEMQSDTAFCVHHIDYDKVNCSPNNLITLCLKCHIKTNGNRKYWKEFFTKFVTKNDPNFT